MPDFWRTRLVGMLAGLVATIAPAAAQTNDGLRSWAQFEAERFGTPPRSFADIYPAAGWTVHAGGAIADYDVFGFLLRAYQPFAAVSGDEIAITTSTFAGGRTLLVPFLYYRPGQPLNAVPIRLAPTGVAPAGAAYTRQTVVFAILSRSGFDAGLQCQASFTGANATGEALIFEDGSRYGTFTFAEPRGDASTISVLIGRSTAEVTEVTVGASLFGDRLLLSKPFIVVPTNGVVVYDIANLAPLNLEGRQIVIADQILVPTTILANEAQAYLEAMRCAA